MSNITNETISVRTYLTSVDVSSREDAITDSEYDLCDTKSGTEQSKKTPYYIPTVVENDFETWKLSTDIDEMLYKQYAIEVQKTERARVKSSLGLVKSTDKVSTSAIAVQYDAMFADGRINQEQHDFLMKGIGKGN